MDHPEYTFDHEGGVAPKPRSGDLPRRCPNCGSELEVFRARRPRGFKPLGVAVSAWPLLASLSALLIAEMGESSSDDRILKILFVFWLAVPPLIGSLLLYRMPRLVPMECYTCGWKREFPIKANRSFDIDEDLD